VGMSKAEALTKIEELRRYVAELDNKVSERDIEKGARFKCSRGNHGFAFKTVVTDVDQQAFNLLGFDFDEHRLYCREWKTRKEIVDILNYGGYSRA
jgi:hypothetical protein